MADNKNIQKDLMAAIHLSQLMNLEIKFRDVEGRFLAENKVPLHYRDGLMSETSECPYTGSRYRHDKPMNISALKQMIGHWTAVKSHFNALRSYCLLDRTQDRTQDGVTVQDFFEITVAGYMVPSFLYYCHEARIANQALPGDLAALYKASLGMVTAAQVMLTKGVITGEFPRDRVLDAETIFNFADKEGLFIGAAEVCAGPNHLILELLQVIAQPCIEPDAKIAQLPELSRYFRYLRGAEQVLLLDFFFPLILAALTPNGAIVELCRIMRAPSDTNRHFSGEISMELQLLDIVAPIIDRMTVEQREQTINDIWAIIRGIDGKTDVIDRLTTDDRDYCEQACRQIGEFLAGLTIGIATQLGDVERVRVIEVLVSYLILEQKKLQIYFNIQQEMNQLLGLYGECRAPDGLDITRMYNKKLRDVLADFLSIKIENHPDQIILMQGSDKLVIL